MDKDLTHEDFYYLLSLYIIGHVSEAIEESLSNPECQTLLEDMYDRTKRNIVIDGIMEYIAIKVKRDMSPDIEFIPELLN